MNESYSFKDILFGLYNEYILLQEQLNSLNKYILLEENNLSEVKFYLTNQLPENRVRMLCTLYDRKKYLEKILEKIKINLGIYPDYRVSYINRNNGKYVIEKYPEIVDELKKQEFSQSVFYILNTEIGKNIRLIHSGTGYDDKPFLSVGSHGIYMCLNDMGNLSFNPSKDLNIHAYSSKGMLTKEKMECMFNMEFSRSRFPEYYQNLIDNSSSLDKTIDIVGDFGYSKNGDFEIIEESK